MYDRIARLIMSALLITLVVVGGAACIYLVGAILGFWRLP
jgi:hypothetical protein